MSVVDKMKKKTTKKKVSKATTVVEDIKKLAEKPELEEGMALIEKGDKTKEVTATHALAVMVKQGWDIKDINLDVEQACVFCDMYQIMYNTPPTKSNLMEAITKRF